MESNGDFLWLNKSEFFWIRESFPMTDPAGAGMYALTSMGYFLMGSMAPYI